MSGIGWLIRAEVECESCGDKRFKETCETSPYKFVLVEETADQLRMDLLERVQIFDRWEVRDLEVWDDEGKFYCLDCQRK